MRLPVRPASCFRRAVCIGIPGFLLLSGCSTTAFDRQLQQAQAGNPLMQYHVGMLYGCGAQGMTAGASPAGQDIEKAMEWFERAAENGDGRAMLALGLCYYYHIGVLRDYTNYEKAFRYFLAAEEKGVPDSYLWLGECYLKGRGTAQNEEKAIDCFRKGAEESGVSARYCMSEIGACYLFGYGVGAMRNYTECQKWYRLAAENGDAQAKHYLDDNVLTMDYFNDIGNRNEKSSRERKSGYRVVECARTGNTTRIRATLDENAEVLPTLRRLKADLLADCENDLMLRERRLSREEVGWDFAYQTTGAREVECSITWIYMRVVSHEYNPETRTGKLVLMLGEKSYRDARDYLVEHIDAICSTKLVSIKDGSIPQGTEFEFEKEVRDSNGMLTVYFKAVN